MPFGFPPRAALAHFCFFAASQSHANRASTCAAVAPRHAPPAPARLSHVAAETPRVCAATSTAWSCSADHACCFGASADPRADPSRRSGSSAHALIATRGAGDVVGEMSLLTPGAEASLRSASVRASSKEVRCSVISKEELWRSLREQPEALEELRLRSVGRESELIVGRALLRTGSEPTVDVSGRGAKR